MAMTVFRGDSYDPSEELAEMQREAEQAASRKSSIFDLIRTRAAKKALLASLGGMFFQQLSGINAVIFYTVTIFQASGSSMSPELASIVIAIVQVRLLIFSLRKKYKFLENSKNVMSLKHLINLRYRIY